MFDDHPARSIPRTPIDEHATRKKMPMLKSMICRPLPQGSTDNHQVGCQCEQEFIDMVEVDKFLDKDLEHVGKALQKSERAYTVRAEAALESGADLAFKIDVEQGQERVYQQ